MHSFFAVEVVQILRSDKAALRSTHQPFLTIVKIRRLADGVIRYDGKNKVQAAAWPKDCEKRPYAGKDLTNNRRRLAVYF